MTFTVNRKTWWRGKEKSELLKANGKKCCVGFMCLKAGFKRKYILKVALVDDIRVFFHSGRGVKSQKLINFIDDNIRWLTEAYGINDDMYMDDDEREKRLKAIFKQHGHTIKFIGGK